MVLKLYGHGYSNNTVRVAIVLHEVKVPFEFHTVDLQKGEHKTPGHIEKHPFGQVPYIDDDGFILYESRAICHYLATKYAGQGPKLIPTEPKANALFQQACWSEALNFSDSAGKAYYEKAIKPYRGLTPDTAVFDAHIATLNAKLDVYDKILSKQKYLAGDEITLADLSHISVGSALPKTGVNPLEDEKRPNVLRWWKDITSRPSWQAVKDGVKSTA